MAARQRPPGGTNQEGAKVITDGDDSTQSSAPVAVSEAGAS